MTYDRLTIAVPSMSKHHATMLRVATSKMLDASIKYASTDDRRHFDDMMQWQDMLWNIAKQVAASEAAADGNRDSDEESKRRGGAW